MAKRNQQDDANDPVTNLDLDHELPSAEDDAPTAAMAVDVVPLDEYRKLKEERDALFDRAARQQAEFDNFRKRNAREQADFKQYALADTVKTLLPILDSLQRALDSAPPDDKMRQGVELILRQFNDALTKLGVEPLEAKGKPFDPTQHEAVEMVETQDAPDHQVIDELQRGYRIKDRLLRPAMVRVARNTNS
jgi:molecular chaperone GrpE